MEHLHVLSNSGSGVLWWGEGPEGVTVREPEPPAVYLEICRKQCFYDNHAGLYVFGTNGGASCCFAASVPTGRRVGNALLLQSILIVSDDGNLTAAMQGLANLYLQDSPFTSDDGGENGVAPLHMGRALALIQTRDRMVQVNWGAMRRLLRAGANGDVPVARSDGAPWVQQDTRGNRRLLAERLRAAHRVPARRVLAAVSWGIPIQAMPRDEVQWALTDAESLGEDPQPDLTPELTPPPVPGEVLLAEGNVAPQPWFFRPTVWLLLSLALAVVIAATVLRHHLK